MSITKKSLSGNSKQITSQLHQVIDVIQEDVRKTESRRKYETFITGSESSLTSSLFQTVYDQNFSLQTANPILDVTCGLYHHKDRENLVTLAPDYSIDSVTEQLYFSSTETCMIREKVNIYRQYANLLLGDPNKAFMLDPVGSWAQGGETAALASNKLMDACLFINVKRLFSRDGIRKETFALRIFRDLCADGNGSQENILNTSDVAPRTTQIIADIGANSDPEYSSPAGRVGRLRRADGDSAVVGLIFYDAGIVVLNLGNANVETINNSSTDVGNALLDGGLESGQEINYSTIFFQSGSASQTTTGLEPKLHGQIPSVGTDGFYALGSFTDAQNQPARGSNQYFYPDLLISGSVDTILDHICQSRFQNSTLTAMAFQNNTTINSNILFCRADADSFNSSNNPTWLSSDGTQSLMASLNLPNDFVYITTIGIFSGEDLVAVAKLNRPVEKNEESDINFRIRLDF